MRAGDGLKLGAAVGGRAVTSLGDDRLVAYEGGRDEHIDGGVSRGRDSGESG